MHWGTLLVSALPLDESQIPRAAEEMIAEYGDEALSNVDDQIKKLKSQGFDSVAKTWELIREVGLRRNNDSPTLPSGFNYCAEGLGARVFTQPGSKAEVQRGPRNVRSWGQSGSRFRAAGCLLLARSGLSASLKKTQSGASRCRRVGAVHCIKNRHSENADQVPSFRQTRLAQGLDDLPIGLGAPRKQPIELVTNFTQ